MIDEEIRNMEEKKNTKKKGRIRKFFRRLWDAVVCCVRRQSNN